MSLKDLSSKIETRRNLKCTLRRKISARTLFNVRILPDIIMFPPSYDSIGISVFTSWSTDNVHPIPSGCNAPATFLNAEPFRRPQQNLKAKNVPLVLIEPNNRNCPQAPSP